MRWSRVFSVAVLLAALPACASLEDKWDDLTVYNGMSTSVRMSLDVEGRDSTTFRLAPGTSRVIGPPGECRYTTLEVATPQGEPIDSFKGDLCTDESLVVDQDGVISVQE